MPTASSALTPKEAELVTRILVAAADGMRTYADMLEKMDDEVPAHQAMRIYASQLDHMISGIKTPRPN